MTTYLSIYRSQKTIQDINSSTQPSEIRSSVRQMHTTSYGTPTSMTKLQRGNSSLSPKLALINSFTESSEAATLQHHCLDLAQLDSERQLASPIIVKRDTDLDSPDSPPRKASNPQITKLEHSPAHHKAASSTFSQWNGNPMLLLGQAATAPNKKDETGNMASPIAKRKYIIRQTSKTQTQQQLQHNIETFNKKIEDLKKENRDNADQLRVCSPEQLNRRLLLKHSHSDAATTSIHKTLTNNSNSPQKGPTLSQKRLITPFDRAQTPRTPLAVSQPHLHLTKSSSPQLYPLTERAADAEVNQEFEGTLASLIRNSKNQKLRQQLRLCSLKRLSEQGEDFLTIRANTAGDTSPRGYLNLQASPTSNDTRFSDTGQWLTKSQSKPALYQSKGQSSAKSSDDKILLLKSVAKQSQDKLIPKQRMTQAKALHARGKERMALNTLKKPKNPTQQSSHTTLSVHMSQSGSHLTPTSNKAK